MTPCSQYGLQVGEGRQTFLRLWPCPHPGLPPNPSGDIEIDRVSRRAGVGVWVLPAALPARPSCLFFPFLCPLLEASKGKGICGSPLNSSPFLNTKCSYIHKWQTELSIKKHWGYSFIFFRSVYGSTKRTGDLGLCRSGVRTQSQVSGLLRGPASTAVISNESHGKEKCGHSIGHSLSRACTL